MAHEAESAIYNRLNAAPSFHPASASLFANDWTLESGDVVSVVSGQDTYSVPVYGMNLKWNGGSNVEVQSTGNEKRDPLPALQRKSYGSGSGAYKKNKEFESRIDQSDDMIRLVVQHNDQTGENVIKAAEIVVAINRQTGQSTVHLSGDMVDIQSLVTAINASQFQINASNTTITGYLQTNDVYIKWLEIAESLSVLGASEFSTVNASSVSTDGYIDAGTTVKAGDGYILPDGGTDKTATWQSTSVVTNVTATYSQYRFWVYATQSTDWQNHLDITSSPRERFVEDITKTTATIHYLGGATT